MRLLLGRIVYFVPFWCGLFTAATRDTDDPEAQWAVRRTVPTPSAASAASNGKLVVALPSLQTTRSLHLLPPPASLHPAVTKCGIPARWYSRICRQEICRGCHDRGDGQVFVYRVYICRSADDGGGAVSNAPGSDKPSRSFPSSQPDVFLSSSVSLL